MANPGDGFTVVTAMRYSQTYVLTLLVSGYPDAWSVMNAIILEADAIIVNPFKIQVLAELIREKMIARKPAVRSAKVKSGRLLQRRGPRIIEHWLARDTAIAHGKLRSIQGYTPAMLVHESGIPQVTLFGTLRRNRDHLEFSLLLHDVTTIADEGERS
jgi:hypothetical protein